jgi:ABC-2 type transport system ATP-binding protein
MQPLLEVRSVSKFFGNKTIYENISYSFKNGCYAIIGPNGTGKTVLIEMLAGVVMQDAGLIYLTNVGNNQSQGYKKNLVYVPSNPSFFPGVTGNDFLNFIVSVKKWDKNHSYVKDLIDSFKLKSHLHSKFSDMSLGTQKKLFLTTLAIGNSKLIILDEPTNALDEQSTRLLHAIIKKESADKIVIIATHDENLLSDLDPTIINLQSNPIKELY